MDNIIYLPKPEEMGDVYTQINVDEIDEEKRAMVFSELAERVIEHSDQLKKIFQGDEYE